MLRNHNSMEYIQNVLAYAFLQNNFQSDEISNSLKVFAINSNFTFAENVSNNQSHDDIMREFAANGYSSDVIAESNKTDIGQFNDPNNLNGQIRRIQSYGDYKKFQKKFAKFDKNTIHQYCVFCENNNEPEALVRSHAVRDVQGRVLCPKLRTYVCPICGESGDRAHTVKYCPRKPIITMEDAIRVESYRLAKSNYCKMKV